MVEANTLVAIYILISITLASLFLRKYKKNRDPSTIISALIVGWSGLIYLNHFSGVIPVDAMYYADWIISTPLLVLSLSYITQKRITQSAIYAALLQAFVIATGYLALTNPASSTFWFFVGNAALLGVFYYIWQFGKEKLLKYGFWTALLVGTWIAYPAVWWYYDGQLSMATTALVVLPFFSKHVFTAAKEYLL